MTNELMAVNYEINGEQVQLTQEDVKKYLVSGDASKVTDKEFKMFMELCKAQRLNPFLREAYLIKFGQEANIIVGKDVFLKRARNNPSFKGFKAGILLLTEKGLEKREGTFYIPKQEQLVGGWACVYIDGWEVPLENSVGLQEFNKGTATWKNMPAVMIRKTALVQALREAFPDELQALYDQSEMGTETPIFTKSSKDTIPEAEFEEVVSNTITTEQQKFLFQAAQGKEDVVREVISNYGFASTKDIEKQYFEDIVRDIEESIQVTGE